MITCTICWSEIKQDLYSIHMDWHQSLAHEHGAPKLVTCQECFALMDAQYENDHMTWHLGADGWDV
jgi:hypothetical protein